MRPFASRLCTVIVALVAACGAFTPAYAEWMDVATISSTIGNNANRLCMGGGRTDIGCPADAPLLDRANNLLTVPTDLRVVGNLLVSGSQQFDGVTFANGGVVATGTVSATNFVGDGSGLTGIDFSNNPIDRIVSGTAAVIAEQGGTVGLTLGGVANVAYFHPTLGFVGPGVSVTGIVRAAGVYAGGTGVSGSLVFRDGAGLLHGNADMRVDEKGNIGVGIAPPSGPIDYSMEIAGDFTSSRVFTSETWYGNDGGAQWGNNVWISGNGLSNRIRFATDGVERMRIVSNGFIGIGTSEPSTTLHVNGTLRVANGGENCDADRLGAIRFNSGQMQICRNGTTWENLVAGGSGVVDADRITSGTTAVITHNNTSVTITTNGSERVVVGTSGNVGIGLSTPDRALTVRGVVSATMVNVGDDPAVTCTIAEYGTLKVAGGKMFMCRQ